MSSELEKLRELMDESVYKKKRFTDKEMKELFRNVRSKEKRFLWIPQTLTVIFTLAFFLVGGMYVYNYLVDDEQKRSEQTASEGLEASDRRLPEGEANPNGWENIHSSELKMSDFISLASLEDEDFLNDFDGPVRVLKRKGEDTLIRHHYKSEDDSSEYLIIEQWYSSSNSPAWLEDEMGKPETKEILKGSGTTIYLRNDGEMNIGFITIGKFILYVFGNEESISLAAVQRILEKITEGKDFSGRMIENEGRP
jgi:hypothetical protein